MKKGISLIVLVITIIVMIILAASVVISLNNTGIINKASEAVDLTDEKQVQDLAALIWAEAYLDETRIASMEEVVKDALVEQGVTEDKWNINVTETGVTVTNKNKAIGLGSLITAADYGTIVNYEANGVTDWQVFYEDEINGYVYLIASEELAYDKMPTNLPRTTVTSETVTLTDNTIRTVGQIHWSSIPPAGTIQNASMWMANWSDYTTNTNAKCVSYFLDETYWTAFKNTSASYASYVLGAIGTPTAEMFVASWNDKRAATNDTTTYNKKLSLVTNGTIGYYTNDITTSEPAASNTTYQSISTIDSLYIWSTASDTSIRLASPSAGGTNDLMLAYCSGSVTHYNYRDANYGVRPVVCLKSTIPATVGNGDYDFNLVK